MFGSAGPLRVLPNRRLVPQLFLRLAAAYRHNQRQPMYHNSQRRRRIRPLRRRRPEDPAPEPPLRRRCLTIRRPVRHHRRTIQLLVRPHRATTTRPLAHRRRTTRPGIRRLGIRRLARIRPSRHPTTTRRAGSRVLSAGATGAPAPLALARRISGPRLKPRRSRPNEITGGESSRSRPCSAWAS